MPTIGYPTDLAFVGYAAESGSINDAVTPATLPAAPSPFQLCGWSNLPDRRRGLNNSQGRAIGTPYAAYTRNGVQTPGLSLTLKGGGALGLLSYAARTGNDLTALAFFVGVPNVWTEVYRFAKINTLGFTFTESAEGEPAEIQIAVGVEATAFVLLDTPLNPNVPDLLADLAPPLFWHDIRTRTVTNGEASPTTLDLATYLMQVTVQVNHNIMRKAERPDWGPDAPLSRTNYDLMPRSIDVNGELSLHRRLPASFWTASDTSQDWGDLVFSISDAPRGGSQTLDITLGHLVPSDEVGPAGEPNTQISHTVPFTARTFTIAVS